MSKIIKLNELLLYLYKEKIKLIQSITYDMGLMTISLILLSKLKSLLMTKYNDKISEIKKINELLKVKYGYGSVNVKTGLYIILE